MGYQHKRDICAKGTKELLENVLVVRKSEYEFIEAAETVVVESPMEKILKDEVESNVLPGEVDMDMTEAEDEDIRGELEKTEKLQEYSPTIKIESGQKDAKEEIEKRKKKRNYVEFRFDYAKY